MSLENIQVLINQLGNRDHQIANNAKTALIQNGGNELEVLINALEDTNPLTSHHIAEILGEIGGEKACQALSDILYKRILHSAIQALGNIGNQKAIPALLDIRHRNILPTTAKIIGQALVKISKESIEKVSVFLQDEKYTQWAVNVLNEFGSEGQQEIVKAFNSSTPTIKRKILYGICDTANRALFPLIVETIHDLDENQEVRKAAIWCTRAFKTSESFDLINETLKSDRPERTIAIGALTRLKGKDAVPELLNLLEEPRNKSIISTIAHSISHLVDASFIPKALQLIKKKDHRLRDVGAEILYKLGDHSLAVPLIKAMSDGTNWVSLIAFRALGQTQSPSILPFILNCLNDPLRQRYVVAALECYGKYAPEVSSKLLSILMDPQSDDWQIANAIQGLGYVGNANVSPILVGYLIHENAMFRSVARTSLSYMTNRGEEIDISELVEILDKSNIVESRDAAAFLLGNIAEPKQNVITPLQKALDDPDENVRATAIFALRNQNASDNVTIIKLIELLSDVTPTEWGDKTEDRICDLAVIALSNIDHPDSVRAVEEWKKKKNNPNENLSAL